MHDRENLGSLECLLLEAFDEQDIRQHARRLQLAAQLPGQGVTLEQLAIDFASLLRTTSPGPGCVEARLQSYATVTRALRDIARIADAQVREVDNNSGQATFLPSSRVADSLASAMSGFRAVEQDLRLRESAAVTRFLDHANGLITSLQDTTARHCDLRASEGMHYDLFDDDMEALRAFVKDVWSCCRGLEAEGRRLAGASPPAPPGGDG